MKDTLKYTRSYETQKSLQYYSEAIFNVGLLKAEETLLNKYFKDQFNIKIADLGCGPGRFTFNTLLLGYLNIDGYDISRLSIKLAKSLKQKYLSSNPKAVVNFYQDDLTQPHFLKQDYYHLAFFTFNSLMCIPRHENKIKALQSAWNSLLKGGILIFTADEVDNDDAKQKYIQEQRDSINNTNWRAEDVIYHIDDKAGVLCFYNKSDVLLMIKQANLPTPIFIAKRDQIAQESEQTKKFSDNAYYYVLKK
ncbi:MULTISPECIES: class I SAM-dependent methyltransferase [unclassified Mycoplasma]|uniref:class I SAM-dependent methyltransferase n=1 Tax=unclassified Mycoplasma TaxID=2683645 RepID=UPI00211C4707|nr:MULTISPECIES: class I SAM-dependent methyltransferase [unclassified Mycoplasma]UUM19637.1 class I SAM-dependent methyltransferase [Mycoplasma sp. 1578d]UUM24606.1 class I SAM-dependent methyltransferase [Mycoplasma sp. 3686d]